MRNLRIRQIWVAVLQSCHRPPAFTGPPDQRVHLLMKQWEMDPRTIVVASNAKVEPTIDSAGVEQDLAVPMLDIEESAKKGEPVVVRFITSRPRGLRHALQHPLRAGHDQMKGRILVR